MFINNFSQKVKEMFHYNSLLNPIARAADFGSGIRKVKPGLRFMKQTTQSGPAYPPLNR